MSKHIITINENTHINLKKVAAITTAFNFWDGNAAESTITIDFLFNHIEPIAVMKEVKNIPSIMTDQLKQLIDNLEHDDIGNPEVRQKEIQALIEVGVEEYMKDEFDPIIKKWKKAVG